VGGVVATQRPADHADALRVDVTAGEQVVDAGGAVAFRLDDGGQLGQARAAGAGLVDHQRGDAARASSCRKYSNITVLRE